MKKEKKKRTKSQGKAKVITIDYQDMLQVKVLSTAEEGW